MSNVYHNLAGGSLTQDWSDTGLISASDDWSGVPSIFGYLGDIDAGTTSDVDPRTRTDGALLGAVDVNANQTAPNTFTSGGVAEFHLANPTIALNGSGTADNPSLVLFLNATGRENVRVQAVLRDLDSSVDNAAQQFNVQYRTSPTGAWTNVPGGYFADVTSGPSLASLTTTVDLVLPADANNAAQLQVRLMTSNATGSDEWVGIDDIVVSSVAAANPGSFAINDVTLTEGDAGTTDMTFTVTRSGGTTGAVSVDFATADGTAVAGSDYDATSGTLSFADGETSKTFTVTLLGDVAVEGDETFAVTLSNATGGATISDASGTGTISDDDSVVVQPGSFSVNDVTAAEGNSGTTSFTFTITRSGGTDGAVSVDFATTNGTAIAGSDYDATSGTLNFADGETSKTVTVTVTGDTDAELNETFSLDLTNATGGATITDATGTGTISNDDFAFTKIHDIQGSAFFSPILAAEGISSFNVASTATVTVRAVVTALDSFAGSDGVRGFYLAEETADWDASTLTSEGIFVRTSGAPTVTVGSIVELTANVMEYQAFSNLNKTILVNPTALTTISTGNPLPTLVIDGVTNRIPTNIISDDNPVFTDATNASGTFDPQNDALDFYETVEGMRVTMTDMIVADGFVGGSNDNFVFFNAYSADNADPALINSRGGYTTYGDPELYPEDTLDPTDDVQFGGSTVHDGATHGDIIELDFGNVGRGGTAAFDQLLDMGDSLGDVSGVIDFDFGVAKLYVTDALDAGKVAALGDTTPVQEVTTLADTDARSLRIATFNVENLSPVGTVYDERPNPDLVTQQSKFDLLAQHIATNLDAPDILIIEEVLDNNGASSAGTADADLTWDALVAAVNAATGKTYQWVDEVPAFVSGTTGDVGGAPSANQRVGFIYDTARVQLGDLAADASIEDRRKYTDRIGDGVRDAGDLIAIDDTGLGINAADWSGTRRSIVAEFTFNGQTIYTFGSHLPSKGGSDDPYEIDQNGAAGEPTNGDWALRNTLAQDIWQVQNLAAQSGLVVSGGDFNEFWYSRPLEVLTGYANPDGTANTTGADFVNLMVQELAPVDRFSYDFDGRSQVLDTIIADQALAAVASYDVVHINTGYNERAGAVNPASSDHDPSLASFDMRSFAEVLNGTAGTDVIDGFAGDDSIAGGAGNDSLTGGEGSDTARFAGARAGYAITNQGRTVTDIDLSNGDEGTDTLTGIEYLQFADQTVATEDFKVYTLQLLHLSDGEAGLLASTTAKNLAAMVDAYEDTYVNSITLAGGDTFLPGPFLAAGTDPSVAAAINAATGSTIVGSPAPGVVDTAIHNIIGVQASGIGNHEWDLGSNVYASTLAPSGGWVGAQYASISANLVLAPAGFAADPLNGRFTQTVGTGTLANEEASDLKGRIAPSAVINEGGETIGLVGVTTQILESISSPTGAEILGFPFGPGANGETNDMALLAAQIQPVINDLIAQGVNKIILLSHLQQIQFEKALAPLLTGVDIILAAGSNTRLGDADDEAVSFPGHDANFADTYPIVTAGADGKTTLIVNTDNEYTYLGRLVVDFDDNGEIILDSVANNVAINGAYASTDENVAEAWGTTVDNLETTAFANGTRGDLVRDLTDAVANVIEAKDGNVYGYSNVYLEGERIQVRNQETNLGNVSADANADAARDALGLSADHAIVSIKNGGGIRAQIGTIVNNPDGTVTKVAPAVDGEVSQLDVENALRFDNKLMVFDTTAQGLLNILNSPNALAPNNGGFIQIGGVRFSYDPTKAAGSRVQDIVLVNENGQITAVIADNGVVNPNAPALITAVVLNFTANGGDGYLIKANGDNFRYILNDGTLSAPVAETVNFTDPAIVPANALGEQQAFAEYFAEHHGTRETAYNEADTVQALDTRIQNQAVRTDTVLEGDYLILGTDAAETLNGTANAETLKGLAGNDIITALGGDDVLNGGAGADTLDGGEGVDTASYADAAGGVSVDLARKKGSYGEALGDKFVSIENLTGSDFDDVLIGDKFNNVIDGGEGADVLNGGNGNDVLNGGDGDDHLIGGRGTDTMTGGAGADVFAFFKADSGKTSLFADIIADFDASADIIDLSAIDANSKNALGTEDAFSFIGTAAFTKVAGELRYEVVGGESIVSADITGDGKADMVIRLSGVATLGADDFVL